MKSFSVLLVCSVIVLEGAARLQDKYPFSAVLFDEQGQYYELHWNFTKSTESIYFAVNVSTTGWVGFGLSPNGQMPGSDVVMGWVSNTGESYFWDRYAVSRSLPPIDTVSQDWFLTNSVEANGYTVLEFSRNFTSCDPQDLDITASTARVVWSYNMNDPTDPSGSDAIQHQYMGSKSINLLGGLAGSTATPDQEFLDVVVSDVTIPSASTTYWCSSFRLPSELINTTHYITRISPVITPHASSFVHHLLVYLCNEPLRDEEVGASAACNAVNRNVSICREGLLVGGWAVGGEDFVYPDNIAYPVGGIGREHFAVMEVHYDNQGNVQGVVDNSGLRFYFTTEARDLDAGIMYLGHRVTPAMLIPPRTRNYTVAGLCSADCTSSFIPEEGIRIFGGLLHTHLIGRALTIQHFRPNAECGGFEELEPIDQNLNYDFNFQQFTHLPREHIVLPGDFLVLRCEYESTDNAEVVLGGESTVEEMCLAFPVFYPRAPDGTSLINCASLPIQSSSFNDFIGYLSQVNPEAAQGLINGGGLPVLNSLDWAGDPQLARSLQDSILESPAQGICRRENGDELLPRVDIPESNCSYEAPDRCNTVAGATRVEISVGAGSFLLLLSTILLQ